MCVWSVVVLAKHGEMIFGAVGALPGRQTVPLSELFGSKMAQELTQGNATHVLDAKYVVNGTLHGAQHPHPTNNLSWARLWEARNGRSGLLKPVWIPNHLEPKDLAKDNIPHLYYLANFMADYVCDHFSPMV